MLHLLCGLAMSAPADPHLDDTHSRLLRSQGVPLILGGADRSPMHQASQLLSAPAQDGWYDQWVRLYGTYDPEDLVLDGGRQRLSEPVVGLRATAWTGIGGAAPQGTLGDIEEDLVSLRAQAELVAYTPWYEARVVTEIWSEAPSFLLYFPVREAYGGFRHGPWRAGFGMERQFIGPARHGALVLGDSARAFPMGQASYEGELGRAGALRAHVGAGWLQRPRGDVDHPGVLLMDLRWAPTGWLEIGATRFGLFGGAGRPMPSLGQLLLPTDPHVYDDPDRSEPDQDEIAALDARLTLPLPGPLDYLELYTQYGGDDLIIGSIGPLPSPQLAGIANLVGAELSAGPWVVGAEWARLRDDYFRWYQGHRVYHEGFTQDGLYLGHPNGGDQDTLWLRAGYEPGTWGVELQAERVRRTLVLEVLNDSLFTGLEDEQRLRAELNVTYRPPGGGRWRVGYTIENIQGQDFVPGADLTQHRVVIERQGAPYVLWGATQW
ncbi:MAG: capsule assembly Wzi family protein [Myxococcota bacterium]|nr:capsule assembly Wzi family protein [Myxococcota bacterium]